MVVRLKFLINIFLFSNEFDSKCGLRGNVGVCVYIVGFIYCRRPEQTFVQKVFGGLVDDGHDASSSQKQISPSDDASPTADESRSIRTRKRHRGIKIPLIIL